ncbi:protein of unknown function [Pseudomonas sp. JV241A]|nr:protein of unknown function [Pseudomonas sp. JV241A]
MGHQLIYDHSDSPKYLSMALSAELLSFLSSNSMLTDLDASMKVFVSGSSTLWLKVAAGCGAWHFFIHTPAFVAGCAMVAIWFGVGYYE